MSDGISKYVPEDVEIWSNQQILDSLDDHIGLDYNRASGYYIEVNLESSTIFYAG